MKKQNGISIRHNPYVRIKNATSGITLIALVVTIIVLLILAGVSIASLTGENGILTRAKNAVTTSKIKTVEELARLAYSTAVLENVGTVSNATAYSQIFKELTEKGYEVVSVGGTIKGIYIKDSTGTENKTTTTLQQTGRENIKVELDIESGSEKQFVKIDDLYYEIQIENRNVTISKDGVENVNGQNHTITLNPGTTGAAGSMKVKLEDQELTQETQIVSGTQLTIEAGQTKTTYTITAQVDGYSTTLQVEVVANPMYATDLTLSADKTEVEPGEEIQITARKTPLEGTTDTISWRVISGAATIDTEGKLTVSESAEPDSTIEVGATLVRSDNTTTDVPEKTIILTVLASGPKAISIIADDNIDVTETITLIARDENGTDISAEVEWESSNEAAATITQTGALTGVCSTKGTTTITATSKANNSVLGTKEITVNTLIGDCSVCVNGWVEDYSCPNCGAEEYTIDSYLGPGDFYSCPNGCFYDYISNLGIPIFASSTAFENGASSLRCENCKTDTLVEVYLNEYTKKYECSSCNMIDSIYIPGGQINVCPYCGSSIDWIPPLWAFTFKCCNYIMEDPTCIIDPEYPDAKYCETSKCTNTYCQNGTIHNTGE